MSNQIEKKRQTSMQDYFVEQVGRAVDQTSGVIPTDEAKRLAYNLVTQAQDNIIKGGNRFKWNNQNVHNFLSQMVMHVSAGLDASNNEVYAFPYGQEMSVQPSYRGYRKMIKEHAVGKKIDDMQCFAVREGEEFSIEYGALDHKWSYKSKPFNTAPIVGYVTVIVYENGTSQVMEHTLEDIAKRKALSKSPAWKNWEVEMAKAKAIKRHAKTVDIRLKKDTEEMIRSVEEHEQKTYAIEETKIALEEPEQDEEQEVTPETTTEEKKSFVTLGLLSDMEDDQSRNSDSQSRPTNENKEEQRAEQSEQVEMSISNDNSFDESWL